MPFRRVPSLVKDFKKWAQGEVDKSKLSDSATPHRVRRSSPSVRRKRLRKARFKKRRKNAQAEA